MSRKYHEGDEPVPNSGYRLLDFLGRGGFGEVWKASAPGGTEAALKIIQLGGTEGRKEFRALQLVKKIRHTHLVPIYSFWLKDSEGHVIDDTLIDTAETFSGNTKPQELRSTMAAPPVLARPLAAELIIAMGLGDKSLYDRLQECIAEGRDGIPQEELMHYLEDAAEAIDFLNRPLHNLGSGPVAIQHCDIKPHNLMIVGGGTQVCDFGLARMMGADRTTTAAATLAYAAPECLTEGKPSESTDQYSLAVSYYELKTGVLPYRDEALAAVMDAKRQGNLDFSRLSQSEQSVLHRATSQNPTERFPSSREMVKALERAAAANLVDTVTIPSSATKHHKRRKYQTTLAILVLVVCVSLGGYWIFTQSNIFKKQDAGNVGALASEKTETANAAKKSPGNSLNANSIDKTIDHSAPNQKSPEESPDNQSNLTSALLKTAQSRMDEGNWPSALDKCEEALLKTPNSSEAYFLRGRCFLHLEPIDYQKVIADFEKAKSLSRDDRFNVSSDFAAAYLGRGTAFLAANRYREAIADFTQASRYAPQDYRIFSRLGATYLSNEQWQQAVEALSVALEINPNEETDFINRGRAFRKLVANQKAIEDFLRAAAINPQNPTVQFQIGNTYIDLKQPEKAVDAFGSAIELLSKSPSPDEKGLLAQAYLARAGAYLELLDSDPENQQERAANYRKAAADLTRAARLFDSTDIASLALVHRLRLSCFEELKETKKTEVQKEIHAAFRHLEKTPDDADAMNNIAYYLATSTDPDIRDNRQAIAFSTRACETAQWKNPDFLDTLSTAYAENGQFEDAVKWETKALDLAPAESKAKEFREHLEQFEKGQK